MNHLEHEARTKVLLLLSALLLLSSAVLRQRGMSNPWEGYGLLADFSLFLCLASFFFAYGDRGLQCKKWMKGLRVAVGLGAVAVMLKLFLGAL